MDDGAMMVFDTRFGFEAFGDIDVAPNCPDFKSMCEAILVSNVMARTDDEEDV